ncbi:MAG: MBL fold metallo-hydrolase [Candidatus Hodarchaeales archaeon]|jgi:glyoxylase-like metal-dependent hydrolase (beta-lactamase superfamily II)
MNVSSLIRESGRITSNIHHIDLFQYNAPEISSAFLIKTSEAVCIIDCGTSEDVSQVLKYVKKDLGGSLSQVQYLIPSHHHFDHFGGGWKLWEEVAKRNPDVKILTSELTKEVLQHPETHMQRAKRTFGEFIGEMKPLPDKAFEIVKPNTSIYLEGLFEEMNFHLLETPGHTLDHISPILSNHDEALFMFVGESAGTLFHSSKLVTLGTSMPPDFNYSKYIESLKKTIMLNPSIIGFGHFGVIYGREESSFILRDNLNFSSIFRDFVKEKFSERNETKYVVDEFIELELGKRVDSDHANNPFFRKVVLALVYGQLVDLGLRDPK